MADPNWPADVPHKLLRDDFGGNEPALPPRSTPMEGGNTRQRPASTVPISTIQGSIYMENDEYDRFQRFYYDVLKQGTVEFNMPIFITSSYVTKRCQLMNATYKWARMGMGWRITLALKVWNMRNA